jgi:hypothetical protein
LRFEFERPSCFTYCVSFDGLEDCVLLTILESTR